MPKVNYSKSIEIKKSIIDILKNDDYFKSILTDNNTVVIYEKPLADVVIKKYPSISIYAPTTVNFENTNAFLIECTETMFIEVANQNVDLALAIDDNRIITDSIRDTILAYPSLVNYKLPQTRINFLNNISIVNQRPLIPLIDKKNLWTYFSLIEINIKYEEERYPH